MPTINMTAQWIERQKNPEDGRVDWFDEKVPGLGLRISQTGGRVWFVMFRVKGESTKRRLTLGRYPWVPLSEAREKAQGVLLEAKRGKDLATAKQEEKQAPTFKDIATEYLGRHAKQKKRSWKEDARIIEVDLLLNWANRKAKDISRKDVIQLLDDIVDRGAPIMANRVLALVRKIYNWAIGRDLVLLNPCLQVARPGEEHRRDRVLSQDEIRMVWHAMESLEPLMRDMFRLRLLTAQRGGENASMRWEDLDLPNAMWTIPAEVAKNKLAHRVPLSPPAVGILRRLEASKTAPYVFPSRSKKVPYINNVQKAAQRVQRESGVDFVMHDLRRTAASFMTSEKIGVPRLVVSKVLNHVEQSVTAVYDRHSYDVEKRMALFAWGALLEEIVAAKSFYIQDSSESRGGARAER